MKKKLLNLLLTLLGSTTLHASLSANIDGIYYRLYGNSNTAMVTYGSTNVDSYSGDVIIPSTVIYEGDIYMVTSIGELAFCDCSSLTSITIPNSITSIGFRAFRHCSGLSSITIPESVTEIGNNIFEKSGLVSVIIPNTVTRIGDYAFRECYTLSNVFCYSESVPTTSSNAFEGTNKEGVTLHVPESALEQYKATAPWSEFGTIVGLMSSSPIIFFADANVKALCVANWDTDKDGELSEDEAAAVTDLGEVFKGNENISSFNELQYFTGLNSIFPDAFSECSCLKSINIPNSVTSIGNSAFYGCISLNSVTIPNSVTNIQTYAFQNCKGLTSFIIGNSVTYISNTVFYGCNSLKKIIWLTTTPPTGYEYANLDGVINYVTNEQYTELNNKVVYPFLSSLFAVDGIIYVPVNPSERTCDAIDCIYDETSANTKIPLSVSYNGITMNVQRIQPYICYNNKYIDSLYCEYNGNIETYSFFGCTDIKNIVCNINGEIEQEAFKGLSNLMSLSLGSQLNFIGKEAFSGCTSLTEIVSKAVNPPSCGEFAFHEINVWSCKLIVPKGSMVSYREADQWKEFFFIEEDTGSDVIPDPEKKCAIPTISYKNGQLSFESETEGVEFKSSIRDTDINDYSVSVINLSATYTITVYATKDGYENSEVATGTLCWIDVAPQTEGIVDEDAVTEVKAVPVLIQTQGGNITIQGAAEGTPIAIYGIDGKEYGSAPSEKDRTTIATSLRPGSVAVVKIGEKAVKVAIK